LIFTNGSLSLSPHSAHGDILFQDRKVPGSIIRHHDSGVMRTTLIACLVGSIRVVGPRCDGKIPKLNDVSRLSIRWSDHLRTPMIVRARTYRTEVSRAPRAA